MPNLLVKPDGSCVQRTHLARTHDEDGSYEQVKAGNQDSASRIL